MDSHWFTAALKNREQPCFNLLVWHLLHYLFIFLNFSPIKYWFPPPLFLCCVQSWDILGTSSFPLLFHYLLVCQTTVFPVLKHFSPTCLQKSCPFSMFPGEAESRGACWLPCTHFLPSLLLLAAPGQMWSRREKHRQCPWHQHSAKGFTQMQVSTGLVSWVQR